MATQDFKRKLTAILSADVEGYSRLMGDDEAATVRTLTAHREVMAKVIQKHRGRVVDSPGDNILTELASVVDGVRRLQNTVLNPTVALILLLLGHSRYSR